MLVRPDRERLEASLIQVSAANVLVVGVPALGVRQRQPVGEGPGTLSSRHDLADWIGPFDADNGLRLPRTEVLELVFQLQRAAVRGPLLNGRQLVPLIVTVGPGLLQGAFGLLGQVALEAPIRSARSW